MLLPIFRENSFGNLAFRAERAFFFAIFSRGARIAGWGRMSAMIIRPQQMEAFQETVHSQFEEQMAAHVQRLAPELASAAKHEGVRVFVGSTIAAAHDAGFHNRECVRFFVESALVLGHRFATDPQYPWAQEIIGDPELTDEDLRADILWRYVSDYLGAVVGPEQAFARAALGRLEEWLGPETYRPSTFHPDYILDIIKNCYPEKYGYVGRLQLQLLVSRAAKIGMNFGQRPSNAAPLLTLVMICFGHGAADDPLYPLVSEALANSALAPAEKRLQYLYDRTRVYLRRVASNWAKG